MSTPEKIIETNILRWLEAKGIYAWKTKTMGTFNKQRGRFIKGSTLYRTGVADIIGILPKCNGRLFAIEVKSKVGKLQENQKAFLHEIESRGGIAFVARSISDVEKGLGFLNVAPTDN